VIALRAAKNGLMSACRASDHHGDDMSGVLLMGF
jgi:hypothetical protein